MSKHIFLQLLTILVIGLGHVYNGEFSKGIMYYIGSLGISLLTAFLMLILPYPANFLVFFSLGFIYFFYVFLKGWKEAKNKGDHYHLKSYNKLYVYAALVFFSWYISNPLFSHVMHAKGWSERRSSTTIFRASNTRGVFVRTTIPWLTVSEHEGTSVRAPSTSTRQILQAPVGLRSSR